VDGGSEVYPAFSVDSRSVGVAASGRREKCCGSASAIAFRYCPLICPCAAGELDPTMGVGSNDEDAESSVGCPDVGGS